MALIRCPECGKEFSDKAQACPNCGCPKNEINKEPKELSPEDQPDLFRCVECGRPLPTGIDKCIYCGHSYEKLNGYENETNSGITGRKNVKCPICGSKYIGIQNDIPLYRKIVEIWGVGTVLPETKEKYRDDMIYMCKKCNTIWDKDRIIQKGEVKEFHISPTPAVVAGIANIILSILLIILSFAYPNTNALLYCVIGIWILFTGVYSFLAINNYKKAHISSKLYVISTVAMIACNLIGVLSFVPAMVCIISCLSMRMYEIKLS